MRIAAAVPVKDFARAKRRLRTRFDDASVERILRALLADVLGALADSKRVERVFVLTDDQAVAQAARASGATASLRVPDPGLNEAIDAAAAECAASGYDALLISLGDLPLLRGADVDAVIEAGERAPVVIVPAADGGTALLFRRPPLVMPARFGPESCAAHEAAARERGITPVVLGSIAESVRSDLDTPDDAERLARSEPTCRTVLVLRELSAMNEIRMRALEGLPEIPVGDDLPARLAALVPAGPGILVVAQKIVSKAEGRLVRLSEITPSPRALELARELGKDPQHTELVLRESKRVVRTAPGVLITETKHGLICANSGVDLSNAPGDDLAVLLPLDPDASAERIRLALGPGRAVIVSDTFGRPWREGLVDVAIGVAGLAPLRNYIGETDRAGRELQVTVMARADQIAAAAGLLMEKDKGQPAVWVEGVAVEGRGGLRDLLRDPTRDLFR